MPVSKVDWARVNHKLEPRNLSMTEWCGMEQDMDIFKTLLRQGIHEPEGIMYEKKYKRLLLTPECKDLQLELDKLQGNGGMCFCGMYTYGINAHESALFSAARLCQKLSPNSNALKNLSSELTR